MLTPIFNFRNSLIPFDREFFDIFNSQFPASRSTMNRGFRTALSAAAPQVNIWEEESSFHLEAELPGVAAENLEVTVIGDQLTLKGERKLPETGEKKALRRELESKKFSRTIQFACELDSDRVQATLRNGVLTVTLPKAASARAKRIVIAAEQ